MRWKDSLILRNSHIWKGQVFSIYLNQGFFLQYVHKTNRPQKYQCVLKWVLFEHFVLDRFHASNNSTLNESPSVQWLGNISLSNLLTQPFDWWLSFFCSPLGYVVFKKGPVGLSIKLTDVAVPRPMVSKCGACIWEDLGGFLSGWLLGADLAGW